MSSNKSKSGILTAIKNTFVASDGRLRAFWQIMITLFAWYALTLITSYGGALILMKLFDSWGITAANLSYAPAWVQYLVSYQAAIYHAVTAIIAIIAGALLMRRYRTAKKGVFHTFASLMLGFFISIAAAIALALIFLMTDSLRPYSGGGMLSLNMLIMLVVCAVTAASEGILAFGYLRMMAQTRGGRLAGYIAGAAMFFAMDVFNASGAIGVINTLLMGIMLCFIAEKFGTAPVIGIRIGWLWATTSLMSFSGSETSLLRLYTVSENQLTGGEAGLSSGFALTLICAAVIWFALVKPLIPKLKQLRQK